MTNEPVHGALADTGSAFGLSFLGPGYGRTPEDDRLYALGWPKMSWLTPGDASEKELDDRKLLSSRYPFECGAIPAGVVPRRVRTLDELRKNKAPGFAYLDASPIGARERESLFDFALTEQLGFATTMMLESLPTTPVVLKGHVERHRRGTRAARSRSPVLGLRLPEGRRRSRHERRGDEVFEAIAKNLKRIHSSNRESLAVSLSRCAHPRVAEIMTALGTPTAKQWLKEQGGTAVPVKKAAEPAKRTAPAKKRGGRA